MALEIQMDSANLVALKRGNAPFEVIHVDEYVVNSTSRWNVQMFYNAVSGHGAHSITVYDAAGNVVKTDQASPAMDLRPAVSFADNSTSGTIDMDLDEATYGAGSKIEVILNGSAGRDALNPGIRLVFGDQLGNIVIRALTGGGSIKFTQTFQIITV